MFAKLAGTVEDKEYGDVVINVNGVGYLVHCPTAVYTTAKVDEPISLFVETIVREDAINLYGFASKLDREWFRLFQAKVAGVGAKLALTVLSYLPPAELAKTINAKDHAPLTKIPGIGPKVAQRIVAELHGKIPEGSEISGLATAMPAINDLFNDAVSALTNLGYTREKAVNAVSAAIQTEGDNASAQSVIRRAMKLVATG